MLACFLRCCARCPIQQPNFAAADHIARNHAQVSWHFSNANTTTQLFYLPNATTLLTWSICVPWYTDFLLFMGCTWYLVPTGITIYDEQIMHNITSLGPRPTDLCITVLVPVSNCKQMIAHQYQRTHNYNLQPPPNLAMVTNAKQCIAPLRWAYVLQCAPNSTYDLILPSMASPMGTVLVLNPFWSDPTKVPVPFPHDTPWCYPVL